MAKTTRVDTMNKDVVIKTTYTDFAGNPDHNLYTLQRNVSTNLYEMTTIKIGLKDDAVEFSEEEVDEKIATREWIVLGELP